MATATGPKGIDWDKQPLGKAVDAEIAQRLGVAENAVRQQRMKRKIPSYQSQWRADRHKKYLEAGLGKLSDTEVAGKLGVCRSTVSGYRVGLGIPTPPTTRIDWDSQPLGTMPDWMLASLLKTDRKYVQKARARRGVPPWSALALTIEGEPVNYAEAVIDNWFHEQGIEHTAQVWITANSRRYRPDWVLADGRVVEYCGGLAWKGSNGERYRKQYERKMQDYAMEGLNVWVIHPFELLLKFQTEIPVRVGPRACLDCGKPALECRHGHLAARGRCSRCYQRLRRKEKKEHVGITKS